jgi:diaminopimelate decarboxylase
LPLQCIDLGGGFGVPYPDDEGPELNLQTLKKGYDRLAEKYRDALHGVRLIVESGRYLTATAGQFITRVLSTKTSKGKKYIICDGGYSHHPASQPIRCQGHNRYPIQALRPFDTDPAKQTACTEEEIVTVTGPTGTPIDILAKDIQLPPVAPGDLLSIGLSGAYGYTNSCQLFFSSPLPAEIMLYDGRWHVLRKPGTLQQLINDMGKIY